MNLRPTLWRTCRVLANHTRLEMLRCLICRGEMHMQQVAAELDIGESRACLFLRQLNSRGIIRAERRSRWVFYRLGADPSLPGVSLLVDALPQTLIDDQSSAQAFRDLTAFTHERRVLLVQLLAGASGAGLTVDELSVMGCMSRRALIRHLRKLADRGVVEHDGERWRACPPSRPLPRALVRIAAGT